MKLNDAIKKAYKINAHVIRKTWGDKSVSPAFLDAIMKGLVEGIEIITDPDDDDWEIDRPSEAE